MEKVTFAKIMKIVKKDLEKYSQEDIENNAIVELIDSNTADIIQEFSKDVSLTQKDYYTLNGIYGKYNDMNMEEIKFNLVMDTIENNIYNNVNNTISQTKKEALKESI